MNMELRLLGLVQGLLLGLLLSAPLVVPALMPWGVQILFALSAFQLRLADRRWGLRPGWKGWISHIRMAPGRLLPFAATAVVAFIMHAEMGDGQAAAPTAILVAAMLCELLLYPLLSHLLNGWQRPRVAAAMMVAIGMCAIVPNGACQNIAQFALGMTTCVFWLRGPDGDLRSAVAALGCAGGAMLLATYAPATLPLAFPTMVASFTLAVAQTSIVRRRFLPWRQTPTHGAGWSYWRHRRSRLS